MRNAVFAEHHPSRLAARCGSHLRIDGAAHVARAPTAKNPFIYMTTYPRSQNCAYAARVLLARGAS